MDIQALINDIKLKVKVVGIVKTPHGFLFEKSDYDYIFVIGGKVSINETLEEAIKREIMEEIGMRVENVTLCAIVENLYGSDPKKVHEICFVYKVHDIFTGSVPQGFLEVSAEDLDKFDIRPSSITTLLKNDESQFKYIIVNEWKE